MPACPSHCLILGMVTEKSILWFHRLCAMGISSFSVICYSEDALPQVKIHNSLLVFAMACENTGNIIKGR